MNIQIISNPRNGSTYMQRMICHHMTSLNKNYVCVNEPFLIPPEITSSSEIENLFNSRLNFIERHDPVVMKTHITQIVDLKDYGVIDRYYQKKYYTIVILRKDVFQSALSLAIANIKKEFVEYHNFDKVEITDDMIIWYVDNQLWDLGYICRNDFNIQYNEIVYMENLTFDPVVDFANMELCNTPIENLTPFDISKLKAPSKKTIVDNYDHLKLVAEKYLSTKKVEFADFNGTMLENLKIDMRP